VFGDTKRGSSSRGLSTSTCVRPWLLLTGMPEIIRTSSEVRLFVSGNSFVTGRALAALWLRSGCALATLWLRSGCSLAALWLCSGSALAALWLRSGCALAALCTHLLWLPSKHDSFVALASAGGAALKHTVGSLAIGLTSLWGRRWVPDTQDFVVA
jgi:hypothetical protein